MPVGACAVAAVMAVRQEVPDAGPIAAGLGKLFLLAVEPSGYDQGRPAQVGRDALRHGPDELCGVGAADPASQDADARQCAQVPAQIREGCRQPGHLPRRRLATGGASCAVAAVKAVRQYVPDAGPIAVDLDGLLLRAAEPSGNDQGRPAQVGCDAHATALMSPASPTQTKSWGIRALSGPRPTTRRGSPRSRNQTSSVQASGPRPTRSRGESAP